MEKRIDVMSNVEVYRLRLRRAAIMPTATIAPIAMNKLKGVTELSSSPSVEVMLVTMVVVVPFITVVIVVSITVTPGSRISAH